MKKLAAILCLSALTTGAFAQGLVNFANNNSTKVTATVGGQASDISGVGNYYFGLLISAPGANAFTFTGNYATNSVAAGRFVLNGQVVPGWGPGVTKDYKVAGWASSLGATFNPTWLTTAPNGLFGVSAVGTGAAGGTDASGNSFPTYNLFGGSGITTGFTLSGGGAPPVPEPTSMALAGLGAAALLIFRRRK